MNHTPPTADALHQALHAFDFLPGDWRIHHRRLKHRLKACQDWEEFEGHSSAWPVLGGLGNIDDNHIELPSGPYRALTLRSVNPLTGEWTIWWLDGRFPGQLDAPMRGSFRDGTGVFFGDDLLDGRPIRIRFIWSEMSADRARWEQAFSGDGGASWETNWVMRLERDRNG